MRRRGKGGRKRLGSKRRRSTMRACYGAVDCSMVTTVKIGSSLKHASIQSALEGESPYGS